MDNKTPLFSDNISNENDKEILKKVALNPELEKQRNKFIEDLFKY